MTIDMLTTREFIAQCELIDDGTLDTVIRRNGVDVRFTQECAAPYRTNGGMLDFQSFVTDVRTEIAMDTDGYIDGVADVPTGEIVCETVRAALDVIDGYFDDKRAGTPLGDSLAFALDTLVSEAIRKYRGEG